MEHIASRLFHTSWKKIKTTEQYSGFNPVVERSYAKVLCLTCCAINEEDFIFCKKCGSHNASPRPHTPESAQNPNPNKTLSQTHRLLGTTSIINTQEDNITKEKTKFFQYMATKSSTQKSKKILKDFEIFAHSRGLHKYTTLPVQPTFSILEAQDKDILDYLIFKNITSGKTWVHDTNCPSLGLRQKTQSCTTHNCSFNHAAQSMRTGVLHMLKKGFQDIGLSGPWNVASKMGNPVESLLVTEYLTIIKQQQAKAGVTQKQAAILLRDETHRLIQSMIYIKTLQTQHIPQRNLRSPPRPCPNNPRLRDGQKRRRSTKPSRHTNRKLPQLWTPRSSASSLENAYEMAPQTPLAFNQILNTPSCAQSEESTNSCSSANCTILT